MNRADVVTIIFILVAAGLIALPVVAYMYSDHKVIIDALQWQCTEKKTQTTMVPMMVGKTTTVRPQVSTSCVNWRKK